MEQTDSKDTKDTVVEYCSQCAQEFAGEIHKHKQKLGCNVMPGAFTA